MGIYIIHMISHLVGGLVLCITINNLSIDAGYRPLIRININTHMLSHMISHPNTLMGIYIDHMISHLVGGLVLCITINNLSIDGGYRPLIRININAHMLSHMISHHNTLLGIYINHHNIISHLVGGFICYSI